MPDSSSAVLRAVIATLQAKAELQALVSGRIYTDVPPKTPFPYLVVGMETEPFAANDFSGQTHTVRLQAFSRKATMVEALDVRKHAIEALDRQETAITLSSGTLVMAQFTAGGLPFKEDDGLTWQAYGDVALTVV